MLGKMNKSTNSFCAFLGARFPAAPGRRRCTGFPEVPMIVHRLPDIRSRQLVKYDIFSKSYLFRPRAFYLSGMSFFIRHWRKVFLI